MRKSVLALSCCFQNKLYFTLGFSERRSLRDLTKAIDQMNSPGGGAGVKWNHLQDLLKLCIDIVKRTFLQLSFA